MKTPVSVPENPRDIRMRPRNFLKIRRGKDPVEPPVLRIQNNQIVIAPVEEIRLGFLNFVDSVEPGEVPDDDIAGKRDRPASVRGEKPALRTQPAAELVLPARLLLRQKRPDIPEVAADQKSDAGRNQKSRPMPFQKLQQPAQRIHGEHHQIDEVDGVVPVGADRKEEDQKRPGHERSEDAVLGPPAPRRQGGAEKRPAPDSGGSQNDSEHGQSEIGFICAAEVIPGDLARILEPFAQRSRAPGGRAVRSTRRQALAETDHHFKTTVTSTISQLLYATMVKITITVENYCLNASSLCLLSNELANLSCLLTNNINFKKKNITYKLLQKIIYFLMKKYRDIITLKYLS